jgi:hypothetical protein
MIEFGFEKVYFESRRVNCLETVGADRLEVPITVPMVKEDTCGVGHSWPFLWLRGMAKR